MSRVAVRTSATNANRFFFDFDLAAPGGRGGASLLIDGSQRLVSIDGVHKNRLAPPRSTGGLITEGLGRTGITHPLILEGYNVDKTTTAVLNSGSSGIGTLIGNLLADVAEALGAEILRWESEREGGTWHLRIHLSYPQSVRSSPL